MAGFIHCVSFRTPTGYLTSGGGAADSSFPHTNAGDLLHPHRPWKSSGNATSGTTFFGVDFGSAVTLAGVGIDNINLTAVKLQAAADTGFSSSLITTDLTIGANLVERSLFTDASGLPLGRYKHFLSFTGTSFAGASRRYWRILANTSTTITGAAAKMWVGSVAWCRSLTEWAAGTSSYDETPLEATRINDDFAGGGAEPVIQGNPYSAIALGAIPAARATMRSPFLELLRQGPGRPFLFYRNAGDAADFYLGHRAGDVTVRTTAPSLIEVQAFIMRNAV